MNSQARHTVRARIDLFVFRCRAVRRCYVPHPGYPVDRGR